MSELNLDFLEAGDQYRRTVAKRRARAALGVSAGITVVWLVYVTGWGHWGRVTERWVAALTMVFGSFVAGSTPQGGGAVAFPVFTKVLDIPAPVARTFSLCVQAVGMGAATASVVINRRPVVWRAVRTATPVAVVAFLATAYLAGDPSEPFWPSTLPGAYVKMTFTLVIAALAVVVYLGWRLPVRQVAPTLPKDNTRVTAALVVAGLLGGGAASLVGSGADVMIYLCVVVLFGIDARVGVPTSVIPMAALSVVGLVLYGIVDGQLAIGLTGDTLNGDTLNGNTLNDRVVRVGGDVVDLEAARFDLFGLWLAAAPIVAWGAPLGSYVASRLKQRHLVAFVLLLALAEVTTTIIFLDELRTSPALVAYSIAMAVVLIGGMLVLTRHREQIFDLNPFDAHRTLRRQDLDVAEDYVSRLGDEDERE